MSTSRRITLTFVGILYSLNTTSDPTSRLSKRFVVERSTVNWKLTWAFWTKFRLIRGLFPKLRGLTILAKPIGDVDSSGRGVCSRALTQSNCAGCMNIAQKQMTKVCPHTAGAQFKIAESCISITISLSNLGLVNKRSVHISKGGKSFATPWLSELAPFHTNSLKLSPALMSNAHRNSTC